MRIPALFLSEGDKEGRDAGRRKRHSRRRREETSKQNLREYTRIKDEGSALKPRSEDKDDMLCMQTLQIMLQCGCGDVRDGNYGMMRGSEAVCIN